MLGSFVNGILISFLPVGLLPVLGNLGVANSTFSDADFAVSGIFLGKLQEYIGGTGLTITLVAIVAVLIVISLVSKDKEFIVKNTETV